MKKNDVLLILIGLFIAAAAWFWLNGKQEPTEGTVVIYKDGNVHTTLPLSSDEIITVEDIEGGINVVSIKDGKAEMIEANCPDKLCIHTRPAQKNGQSIVCLPNRVVVEVKSAEKDVIDGVSE
ncbi:MAG: NusG domain II-containing protein [Ruminiclostridium sp.]|nr:NusG domain II-containing protein [Ruminiclostridium sp.]